MFIVLFAVIFLILLLGLWYLFLRFRKIFSRGIDPKTLSKKEKTRCSVLAAVPVVIMTVLCVVRPYIFIIPLLHLILIWMILECVSGLIEKYLLGKNEKKKKIPFWLCGALALLITGVYMSIAYYLAVHVVETRYEIHTKKDVPALRIALIADSHLGACFDGEGFAEHMKTIEEQKPDLLVISGDFVDDDSKRKDMVRAVQALGEMDLPYGVFYVPGNHDVGYGNSRDFTYEEMLDEMSRNHVMVLEDEVVELGSGYYLLGRKDRSMERMDISDLNQDLDPDRFLIVLNHQPNDYKAEEAAGCDLVLSGHTHGGQMFPIRPIGELIGANDATYGVKKKGNTTFIVTSGIADWAIPYKSGTISEYCLIDVIPDET